MSFHAAYYHVASVPLGRSERSDLIRRRVLLFCRILKWEAKEAEIEIKALFV